MISDDKKKKILHRIKLSTDYYGGAFTSQSIAKDAVHKFEKLGLVESRPYKDENISCKQWTLTDKGHKELERLLNT